MVAAKSDMVSVAVSETCRVCSNATVIARVQSSENFSVAAEQICQHVHLNDTDNNNSNNNDNVDGAVIVAQSHCESSPSSYDECENGAKRLPALSPGQMTRAVSPPVGCQKPHPPSPFIIITQPES